MADGRVPVNCIEHPTRDGRAGTARDICNASFNATPLFGVSFCHVVILNLSNARARFVGRDDPQRFKFAVQGAAREFTLLELGYCLLGACRFSRHVACIFRIKKL